jgi:hypothetical protein
MNTQIRIAHILKFIVFAICTFQTHFKKRMSLYGYPNARSYICLCVSLHTDNTEKRSRKESLFQCLTAQSVYCTSLWGKLFVLNVLVQYVLSGNYSVKRNQEGTDSPGLGNVTDISHSPLSRFFTRNLQMDGGRNDINGMSIMPS